MFLCFVTWLHSGFDLPCWLKFLFGLDVAVADLHLQDFFGSDIAS